MPYACRYISRTLFISSNEMVAIPSIARSRARTMSRYDDAIYYAETANGTSWSSAEIVGSRSGAFPIGVAYGARPVVAFAGYRSPRDWSDDEIVSGFDAAHLTP